MFRSTVIAAGAVLLCSTGYAQSQMDPGKIYPVTAPVQHAGTFNYATKRWVTQDKADQLAANSLIVYNNTCTWTGAAFFFAPEDCEDLVDEGRIPSTSDLNAPIGATDDNLINQVMFGYCTRWPTGSVDIKIGLYDTLGGRCAGGVAPTPPSLASQAVAYLDFGAAAGNPLPGSTAGGIQACWTVTVAIGNGGACMQSDADGIWDNNIALDLFNWTFQHENPNATYGSGGPLMSGEPSTDPVGGGGCSYSIPCGTDFFSGGPCGHGLDTQDVFWTNVDGDPVSTAAPNLSFCPTGASAGTACYWFGGYPANVFAGFMLSLGSAGECSGCTGNITSYCTAGTSSQNGCNATMGASGVPSLRNLSPFTLTVSNAEENKNGIFFYSISGQNSAPWGNSSSTLCVKTPTQRTPLTATSGSSGCTGTASLDWNGFVASKPNTNINSALRAGMTVGAQFWYRDGGSTGPVGAKGTALSDGVEFTICP